MQDTQQLTHNRGRNVQSIIIVIGVYPSICFHMITQALQCGHELLIYWHRGMYILLTSTRNCHKQLTL